MRRVQPGRCDENLTTTAAPRRSRRVDFPAMKRTGPHPERCVHRGCLNGSRGEVCRAARVTPWMVVLFAVLQAMVPFLHRHDHTGSGPCVGGLPEVGRQMVAAAWACAASGEPRAASGCRPAIGASDDRQASVGADGAAGAGCDQGPTPARDGDSHSHQHHQCLFCQVWRVTAQTTVYTPVATSIVTTGPPLAPVIDRNVSLPQPSRSLRAGLVRGPPLA